MGWELSEKNDYFRNNVNVCVQTRHNSSIFFESILLNNNTISQSRWPGKGRRSIRKGIRRVFGFIYLFSFCTGVSEGVLGHTPLCNKDYRDFRFVLIGNHRQNGQSSVLVTDGSLFRFFLCFFFFIS